MTTQIDGLLGVDRVKDNTVTPGDLTQPPGQLALVSLSGLTFADSIGLPSWVKEFTVAIANISTNGGSVPIIQLGDGAIENSGYLGGSMTGTGTGLHTTGIQLDNGVGNAAYIRHGAVTFKHISGNNWAYFGVIGYSDSARATFIGGRKELTGPVDRVRVTTVVGTELFDVGSTFNVDYR